MQTIITNTVSKYLSGALLLLTVLFASCSKTELEQAKSPYLDILSFKLTNTFNGIDSLDAVISGDSISIYWDQDVEKPAKITPIIKLSKGATISPASGEAVDFSNETIYTVKAEDGTTKTYRLTPILNTPIPVVSLFTTTNPVLTWGHAIITANQALTLNGVRSTYIFAGDQQTDNTIKMLNPAARTTQSYPLESIIEKHRINIEGEYFITGQGGKTDFRVFIRRLSDGFEVETPIETLTENKVTALFPDYSSELDTGAHQLFFRMNGRTFEGNKITIGAPAPGYLKGDFTFNQLGKEMRVGEEASFTFANMRDDYDGSIVKHYGMDKIIAIEYVFAHDGGSSTAIATFRSADLKVNGNTISHVMPDYMASMTPTKLRTISFLYNYADRRSRVGYTTGKKIFPMPDGTLLKVVR